jgi:SAM-dependent methyltransferase
VPNPNTNPVPRKGDRSSLFYNAKKLKTRWRDIERSVDLRPSDRVLDIGCAEGLITLKVAKRVQHVRAFDVSPERIAEARRLAADRGVLNATFEVASIDDYPLEPLSYDVILFLSVWGKRLAGTRTVGAEHLDRIMAAARRQVVMRVAVATKESEQRRLPEILRVCDRHGFDALCFSAVKHGDVILANRRGTDARVGELPALALVPTARLAEHPIVSAATSVFGENETAEPL